MRGQGKFPGLVIRLRNTYDDGTPIPSKVEKIQVDGQERKGFRPEPHLPHLLIESVEFEGPVFSQWPPAIHQRILFDSELRSTDERKYVREVLRRFMTRAYRRPATEQETDQMLAFCEAIRAEYPRLEDAVRETLALILIQPDFLYLMEPAGEEKRKLSDWEMASRLSFFLWSSMPDDRLFELASSGLLHEQPVLRAEVDRMLRDERADRFLNQFVRQWLQLDRLENVSVDSKRYPDFEESLKQEMESETTELVAEILRTDGSALDLLNSNFTMLNERLARHYGIDGIYGKRFRRVELPAEQHRGGLLGQAGILLANSNGKESHPIRRAVWIRDRLLGDPPAAPPPGRSLA